MKNKSQIIKGCALALIPTSICSVMAGANMLNKAYAESQTSGYVNSHSESVTITNASFGKASNPYSSGNTFDGWSAIETESKAFGAIINTDTDATSKNSFANNKTSYHLDENPYTHSTQDTRVLMINSITEKGSAQEAKKGYRSSSITLQANSYYKFTIAVKVALNKSQQEAGASVCASVYLNGLKDKDGNPIHIGYEDLTNTSWQEVNFFVATGKSSQTVTLDLYLGSANGQTSQGAVFFDDAQGTRYSQNEFYDELKSAGYENVDNYKTYQSSAKESVFLVNDLIESKPYIDNLNDYNFDFEKDILDESDTLGSEFMIAKKQNGHALIQDILNMQSNDFKNLTGYDYVGTDLGVNNKQALLLYTGKKVNGVMQNESGYVGVESKEIDIKAHTIYKISLKAKISKIDGNGAFYLKVQENDNVIKTYYPDILTDDSEDSTKTLYTLNNGKTTSLTSNTTNSFENDYQTLTFFVKGHSLYNSSINLELWLGDEENLVKGCVVVDNITVEYATSSDYSNATNKLELKSALPSDLGVTNGRFNSSENEKAEENYLVTATDWTVNKQDNKCDSGIIYLYDQDSYDQMYSSNKTKYPWAGIFPENKANSTATKPNNVYLMNNRTASYQSITSKEFTLSENAYHKLSFSYYNQNSTIDETSKIKVEVIDNNGAVLFSKDNVVSLNKWDTFEVYFHTHTLLSHTAKVRISLGDEDNKVAGLVYLDDFDFTTNAEFGTNFDSRLNKVDLSKLGLNQNASNEISLSGFYTFNDGNYDFTTPITSSGIGGIINGQNNPYTEINDKLRIDGNYMVLASRNNGFVKMTSNYTIPFTENEYYKLTFDLATIINASALTSKTDEHDCKYGISVEIDGYETISGLLSAEEFKTFEIYYKATSTATPNIVIKLVTDCENTYGTALISNLDFAKVEARDYRLAQTSNDLNDKIYISQTKETVVDNETDNDNKEEETTSTSSDNAWILASSIITSVALIIGVVAYAMKHVKLKKIEKIKKESYDRKLAVNHDAIMVQAQKIRDEELKTLNQAKESLLNDKASLEEKHKEFIKSAREKDGAKISKEVEKAFKAYNTSINRMNEKINIIKEKIDYTASAEYLLVIERRVLAEQDENNQKKKKNKI